MNKLSLASANDKLAAFNIGDALKAPTFLREITGLGQLVSVLLNNAIVVAGLIFIFLIVFAGLGMIFAGGNPQKFAQSRELITTALVGFIIVLFAYIFVRIIRTMLGLPNIF